MQNYIKTNILSLGQHFVYSVGEKESVKNSDLENRGKKKKKKKKPGIKFTFRPAVYVPLISSLFSD